MERQARNMVTINSYADLFTAASVKALESDNLDAPMLKRLLSSIVSCLKHSSSMAMFLVVELLQARREAAIERSKILTEVTKNKLRSQSLLNPCSVVRLLHFRNQILNLSNRVS